MIRDDILHIHSSDSSVQQRAEHVIANLFMQKNGLRMDCDKRLYFNNASVDVDLYCDTPSVLAEISAHVGKLKVAQQNKLITDAMKMLYIEKKLNRPFRKIIIVCDNETADNYLCLKRVLGSVFPTSFPPSQ